MANYYAQGTGGQARGPIAVDADAWNPESGAVMSLGARLNDGIVYRAYDTSWCLYYLADAYTPNWLVPYDWKNISDAGAGAGNENQNNMDIIDYNGRRIIAYTQGAWFTWGGNHDVYFLDVTNPLNTEVIAILSGDELAAVDEIPSHDTLLLHGCLPVNSRLVCPECPVRMRRMQLPESRLVGLGESLGCQRRFKIRVRRYRGRAAHGNIGRSDIALCRTVPDLIPQISVRPALLSQNDHRGAFGESGHWGVPRSRTGTHIDIGPADICGNLLRIRHVGACMGQKLHRGTQCCHQPEQQGCCSVSESLHSIFLKVNN